MALIASRRWDTEENGSFVLYGGPRASAFRGDYVYDVSYMNSGDNLVITGDIKESSVLGVFVGAVHELNEHASARIEARLIGEQSISASIQIAY